MRARLSDAARALSRLRLRRWCYGGGYSGGGYGYGERGGIALDTDHSAFLSQAASDIAFGIGMVDGKGYRKSAGLSSLAGGIGALIGAIIPDRAGIYARNQALESRDEVLQNQRMQNDQTRAVISGAGVELRDPPPHPTSAYRSSPQPPDYQNDGDY